jgi:hypothetical protein
VRTDKEKLWKEVDELLRRRPGWTFQAMSAPGAPPAWCFAPEHEALLSVTVERSSICVSALSTDQDVRVTSGLELEAWLSANWPRSLPEQRGSAVDKLKRARLFEWE